MKVSSHFIVTKIVRIADPESDGIRRDDTMLWTERCKGLGDEVLRAVDLFGLSYRRSIVVCRRQGGEMTNDSWTLKAWNKPGPR